MCNIYLLKIHQYKCKCHQAILFGTIININVYFDEHICKFKWNIFWKLVGRKCDNDIYHYCS